MGIETPVFLALGRSVTAALLRMWFSRRESNEMVGQLLEDEVPDLLQRRRVMRTLDAVGDTITERLMRDADMRRIPENERNAAIQAVSESFNAAALTQEDLLSVAMSSVAVAKIVRARSATILDQAALSGEGQHFYHAMIDETCSVLVAAVSAVPGWESQAAAYLLRQQQDLSTAIAAALKRLPSSVTTDAEPNPLFLYERSVISVLDRVEPVSFPVSATIALRLSDTFVRPDVRVGPNRQPLDWPLADHPRLFLHGPAGSGKTSVVQWLAIKSAARSLDSTIRFLNNLLPIYVPLREPARRKKRPTSDARFLASIAFPSVESERVADLIRQRCESGSALLLFDGLDEIDPDSRPTWLHWLGDMADTYPQCRFIVTSRTSPFDVEPLVDRHFATARIEPLDNRLKAGLIRQWFAATASSQQEQPETTPAEAAAELAHLINSNSRLQDLAATPLMCSLMCALFLERGELPLRGADVYAEFVDMLVERRDTVRGIAGARDLPKPEALTLLEELAHAMVLKGDTELAHDQAYSIVARTLPSLTRLTMNPGTALDHLLRRSGLLVEPAYGRTQFIHLTLMEFLAARSFIENDAISMLVSHAHDPAWHSVIVLAASQARPWQGERLVQGLLDRYDSNDPRGTALAAVIQESVAGMVRLSPSLREACEQLWRRETEALASHMVVRLSDGSAANELCDWLAENDELRQSGPVVVSKLRDEPQAAALIIAGDRPLNTTAIVGAILQWYRLRPPIDRHRVQVEVENIRIDLSPSL
ncbi:NACHT domain-containing protein [Micromonospora echinospora]|uniref:NACHT domain-containing protein n=1 Tax=Micromonospora echinospora TaxID=1877 RepID=UPI003A83E7E9